MRERIAIVGAGLVGSLLALYLAEERGDCEVELFDRRDDPRDAELASGRSINLTLCTRGFAALDRVGVGDAVRAIAIPCRGRVIHAPDGSLEHQPYGNRGESIHSISRNGLNRVLAAAALERPGVSARFRHKCLEVDLESPAATFLDESTGETAVHRADRLFGSDGAFSAVRLAMQKTERFDYSQAYLDQAYKELSMPPAPGGGWALEANAIHIWPRRRYMLIGFPNLDGSFTVALHLPYEAPGKEPSFASIRTPEALLALFHDSFPDAVGLMPDLVEEFFTRPETPMVTIRCFPWTFRDTVALLGDSAHAIVPSYGQGANCGFEGCAVLFDLLAAAGGDWRRALGEYQRRRKPEAEAIADLALEHFHELRDRVGDPDFLLRKRIERRLEKAAPERYASLYSLVSFTRLPYTEAVERSRGQRAVVDRVLELARHRGMDALEPIVDQVLTEAADGPAARGREATAS